MKLSKPTGICTLNELKSKEVINLKDGARLGNPADIELDLETGRLVSITVFGQYRIMGLFGKEDDIIIKWEDIKKIGDDVIIIDLK